MVPFGVALLDRIPDHFFAENHFAVYDSRDFAVAGAQVETDAAAFEVTAQRSGALFGSGKLVNTIDVHDFEGLLIDAAAHDLGVELADFRLGVMFSQIVSQIFRAADRETVSAPGPEEELAEPFYESGVEFGVRAALGEDDGAVVENGAVGLLEGDRYRHSALGLCGLGEVADEDRRRRKLRIEFRLDPAAEKRSIHICILNFCLFPTYFTTIAILSPRSRRSPWER